MKKTTPTHFSIHPHLTDRWSTRSFDKSPVEQDKIKRLFEAARWAASAFNEQPWRFIIGQNNDATYQKIWDTLVEWNQQWAKNAPVLILNLAKRSFSHNGVSNVTFKYDLGQAVANLSTEAVDLGLFTHQMSGFDPEQARTLFNIPDDFQAVSVIAVGYYSKEVDLPDDIQKAEQNPRSRNGFNEFVFTEIFGNVSNIFE